MKIFMDRRISPKKHLAMNVIVFVGIFQDGLSELILMNISYKKIMLLLYNYGK